MVDHIREHKLWHKAEGTNWTELLKEKVMLNSPKHGQHRISSKTSLKVSLSYTLNSKAMAFKTSPKVRVL